MIKDEHINKSERLKLIISYLDQYGMAAYRQFEKLLNVSNMTVRRDIDHLAGVGKVIKTLGGVQKNSTQCHTGESRYPALNAHNQFEETGFRIKSGMTL